MNRFEKLSKNRKFQIMIGIFALGFIILLITRC